jgi:hypothetical protein
MANYSVAFFVALTGDAAASFKSPSFRQQMITTLEKVADGDYHQVTTLAHELVSRRYKQQQTTFSEVSFD